MVPIRPAPKTTTSSTLRSRPETTLLHARAAAGEPITTTRSPARTCSSPRGTTIFWPRISPTTLESAGMSASRSGRPMTALRAASGGTSNSTTCTWPSAKTSVWRAAGMPRLADTA